MTMKTNFENQSLQHLDFIKTRKDITLFLKGHTCSGAVSPSSQYISVYSTLDDSQKEQQKELISDVLSGWRIGDGAQFLIEVADTALRIGALDSIREISSILLSTRLHGNLPAMGSLCRIFCGFAPGISVEAALDRLIYDNKTPRELFPVLTVGMSICRPDSWNKYFEYMWSNAEVDESILINVSRELIRKIGMRVFLQRLHLLHPTLQDFFRHHYKIEVDPFHLPENHPPSEVSIFGINFEANTGLTAMRNLLLTKVRRSKLFDRLVVGVNR